MRRALLALLLAGAASASEPQSTPSPRAALIPDRFAANDFAELTSARANRMIQVFPRLAAFLVSRRAEIEAAQKRAARASMPAARSPAIAAFEAWLSQPPSEEALVQAKDYLTAPPHELLRDAALLLAAREEQRLRESMAEVAAEAESTHRQLDAVVNDPKLSPTEKAQLQAQLADLKKAETDMTTTGQPVPPEAVALAGKYKDQIDGWSKWAWPK